MFPLLSNMSADSSIEMDVVDLQLVSIIYYKRMQSTRQCDSKDLLSVAEVKYLALSGALMGWP